MDLDDKISRTEFLKLLMAGGIFFAFSSIIPFKKILALPLDNRSSSDIKISQRGTPTLRYGYQVNKFDNNKTEIELIGTGFQEYEISSVLNVDTTIASGPNIIIENNNKLKILINDRLTGPHIDLRLMTSSEDLSNEIRVNLNKVTIVVFGDSVAWGQGLSKDSKMHALFADYIKTRTNMTVDYSKVFAHSGATIDSPEINTLNTRLGQEVPYTFPTIIQQVDEYTAIPEEVDFVLIIGGINDVGLFNIFTSIDLHKLRSYTFKTISERMPNLLAQVEQKFKYAKIIVPGYYQIISEATEINTLKQFLAALGLLFFPPIALLALASDILLKELSLKAKVFANEANRTLSNIASNRESNRVVFVDPAFTIFNALGAQDTLLWGIGERDDVRELREIQCQQAFRILPLYKYPPYCNDASMGHPNRRGAARYANRIIGTLFPTIPIPDPCQSIVDEIDGLQRELESFQQDLSFAAPGQKPQLVKMIRSINAEIKSKNQELNQCRINNPGPIG